MRKRLGAIFALCMVAAVAAAIPSIAGASPARVKLYASAAPFAKPSAFARNAPASERVSFQVYLGLRDQKGAARLLNQVSDPSSPSYAHYLSPSAFRSRFARSDAEVSAVRSWLSSQHLRVTGVPSNHLWVEADGTAAQVERAFAVQLGYYRVPSGAVRAPDRAPSVPVSLGGVVRGVNLVDVNMRHGSTPPPPAGFRVARPCSASWAEQIATDKPKAYGDHQPYTVCGYSPKQLQGAYGVKSAIAGGTDGSGVTVAVLDAYGLPTMQSDLDTYSNKHGLPQLTITQLVDPPSGGSDSLQQGWWSEEAMDVEIVHSMAPGADILYRGAANPGGALLHSLNDIIDNHRADMITNSWGYRGENLPATQINMYHDTFLQAGAEGIGVYFSSGDCGDEIDPQGACGGAGYRTTDHPASDPDVTAVGGTSLGVGSLNERLFEIGWGTGNAAQAHKAWTPKPPGYFYYGGGGGTSRIFSEPNYQKSVVPAKLSGWWGGANRVVPDVAADGDPNTGFTIGITQRFPGGDHYGEYRLGGTSLSSPLFAGLMALADDQAGFAHGFANPALYGMAGSSAFNDIVTPARRQAAVRASYANGVNAKDGVFFFMRTMNQTGTLHTGAGFDDVTGNGTPNGQDFLDGLS